MASESTNDFEALTRQYWNAWGEVLRQSGQVTTPREPEQPEAPPQPQWHQTMEWWNQLMQGAIPDQGRDALGRFDSQGADWIGAMQQLAARFAGRDTSSHEVAEAWRMALSGPTGLMRWTLDSVQGGTQGGLDPWLREAAKSFEGWQKQNFPWMDVPTFGLARNHQSRWQMLAKAQQEYQNRLQDYVELIKAAIDQACTLFETKLGEHEAPGSQLTSARALFDLWIEAAEEAYSAIALSEEFREVYAEFANAHMRLRAALQQEVEKVCEQFGMPTRTEMDAAHRRIAELERILRRMATRDEAPPHTVDDTVPNDAPANKPQRKRAAASARKPASRSAAKSTSSKRRGQS